MNRILFLCVLCSLVAASPLPAGAESQTWKVRPGDNLEIIAATLEIPKEEIKKSNPGVSQGSLQIGQKLNLPLRSHAETKVLEEELRRKNAALEEELRKRDAAVGMLEKQTSDLEKIITSAESQLRWQPVWRWGFWICFGILGFIFSGACWIFRQTHPRVFEHPRDRSIRDLRESQIRARSTFPHAEEGPSSLEGEWPPSAGRSGLDVRHPSRELSVRGRRRLGSRNGLVVAQNPVS